MTVFNVSNAEASFIECERGDTPYWILALGYLFNYLFLYVSFAYASRKREEEVVPSSSGVPLTSVNASVPETPAKAKEDWRSKLNAKTFMLEWFIGGIGMDGKGTPKKQSLFSDFLKLVSMAFVLYQCYLDIKVLVEYFRDYGAQRWAYNCYALIMVTSPNVKALFAFTFTLRLLGADGMGGSRMTTLYWYAVLICGYLLYIPAMLTHVAIGTVAFVWLSLARAVAVKIVAYLIQIGLCNSTFGKHLNLVLVSAGFYISCTILPSVMARVYAGHGYMHSITETITARSTSAYFDRIKASAVKQSVLAHWFF